MLLLTSAPAHLRSRGGESYQCGALADRPPRPARPAARYTAHVRPHEQYVAREAAREARRTTLQRQSNRLSSVRLALAALVLAMAWMTWYAHWFAAAWITLPALAFAAAVVTHRLAGERLAHASRQVEFYRRALARLEDRWAGTGERGTSFENDQHLYASDLDVFGEGSLFELLCAARTPMGARKLADWLLAPADRAEIERRHQEIADLAPRLDQRERIASFTADTTAATNPGALLEWTRERNALEGAAVRCLAVGLPGALLVALSCGWLLGLWTPAIALLLLEWGALYRFHTAISRVNTAVTGAYDASGLRTLVALVRLIEREAFDLPSLRALQAALSAHGQPASAALDRLASIASLAEASLGSTFVRWFLNVPLLLPLQIARSAERWRRDHAAHVEGWLEATARFEALSSLAQYRHEHPDDPFPEILPEPATFEAHGLGHPLLPANRCVRNDLALSSATPVVLVSGSNMSGKSTLLRAVGLNVVLAMAGAPVRARTLRLSVMTVGASIHVRDSLREGQSRFYAEILRLRRILSIPEAGSPLLFLLDEILQGTNSKDRRIGAEGLLRRLIDLGSVGLATTHDLALTQMPSLAGRVRHVHFGETLDAGQMHFDFTLREGVATRSNGLELMRAMGLRV